MLIPETSIHDPLSRLILDFHEVEHPEGQVRAHGQMRLGIALEAAELARWRALYDESKPGDHSFELFGPFSWSTPHSSMLLPPVSSPCIRSIQRNSRRSSGCGKSGRIDSGGIRRNYT
jgi:hypothetical protein